MKKLLLTQCVGEKYEPVREIVYPNFKAYAHKIGAEFYSIEDRYHECIVMDKLKIADLLSDYDRIIWLDADMIVRPDCPDLFALVPEDCFGGYEEGCAAETDEERQTRYLAAVLIGEFYGLPKPIAAKEWVSPKGMPILPYLNAGLLVVSKQHEPIFRTEGKLKAPPEGLLCPEQGYINYRIWDVKPKVYQMPVCFNQMPWNWTTNHLLCSYIVHYAGLDMKDRMNLMRKGLKVWEEEGYK